MSVLDSKSKTPDAVLGLYQTQLMLVKNKKKEL